MARKKNCDKSQSCQRKNIKASKRLIDSKFFAKSVIANLYCVSRHDYMIFEKNF